MTWLDVAEAHPFGLATLPYGVFSIGDGVASVGVRIGDSVLDLAEVAEHDGHPLGEVFAHDIKAIGVDFVSPPATDGPPTARCQLSAAPRAPCRRRRAWPPGKP